MFNPVQANRIQPTGDIFMKKQILTFTAAVAVAATAAASETIVIDGSTTVGPIAKAFAEYYMSANPEVNITVSESGSGNGAKAMVNGTCDIAIMSRPMKESEFKAAVDNGTQPVAHVVALDGLPILVHPSNPVQDLTVEQVRKIYLGEITNWSEVGGPNKEIVTISRDTNSGTYETFEGLVMDHGKIGEKCEYVGSNGAVRQRVQTTPAAIGYAGLGFVDKTVKALKVNGIYPSAETVQTGEYPIARPLFMYTNAYPKLGSSLYQFVTIHLTEDGQEMVEEIGFVPVTAY
jgi:phosphate transport system substrate-binding protein